MHFPSLLRCFAGELFILQMAEEHAGGGDSKMTVIWQLDGAKKYVVMELEYQHFKDPVSTLFSETIIPCFTVK